MINSRFYSHVGGRNRVAATHGELDTETAMRYASILLDARHEDTLMKTNFTDKPCRYDTSNLLKTASDCISMDSAPVKSLNSWYNNGDEMKDVITYSPSSQRRSMSLFRDIYNATNNEEKAYSPVMNSHQGKSIDPKSRSNSDIQKEAVLGLCSNCGIEGDHSILIPCQHKVCKSCMNTLINSVCNDGGPDQICCFFCSTPVESFGPPQSPIDYDGHLFNPTSFETELEKVTDVKTHVEEKPVNTSCRTPIKTSLAIELEDFGPYEKQSSASFTVIRIDNVIPWDLTLEELQKWISIEKEITKEDSALRVHIICNRIDGRTLSHAYAEIKELKTARDTVRLRNGTKLRHRPVSVVLATPAELLSHLFPSYTAGFDSNGAKISDCTTLLSETELNGLLTLCKLNATHSAKVPERPFMNIASICTKYPWHQKQFSSEQVKKMIYHGAETCLQELLQRHERVSNWREISKIILHSVITCEGFRDEWKKRLMSRCGYQNIHTVKAPLSTPKLNREKSLNASSDWRQRRKQDDKSFPPKLLNFEQKNKISNLITTTDRSIKKDVRAVNEEDNSSDKENQPISIKDKDKCRALKDEGDVTSVFLGSARKSKSVPSASPEDEKESPTKEDGEADDSDLTKLSEDFGLDLDTLTKIAKRLDLSEQRKNQFMTK